MPPLVLSSAGANEVIESTKVGFSLLSHAISQQGSASILSSIATLEEQNLFIGTFPSDLEAPTNFFALSSHLQKTYSILLIGIQYQKSHRINPPYNIEITREHGLIYLAETAQLPNFTPKT